MQNEDRFKKISRKDISALCPFYWKRFIAFTEGDMVEHERFGKGTIISIEGQPPNTTATVEFDKDGSKNCC